jgi:hypothetical protein
MSIASMTLGDAPEQVLQQALYGGVPEIKPYDALGELNKRVKNQQMSSAMQGNNAIQQAQQMQQQPPVAQQIVAQLNQGVGGLPMPETNSYASGGIVAFEQGGVTPYGGGSQEERDRAAIIQELNGMGATVGKMAALGVDLLGLPIRQLGNLYNQIVRVPRAFGADIPKLPNEVAGPDILPNYNKYFGGEDAPVSSGRGNTPGRTADMPAYVPPPAPVAPPNQSGIAAPGVTPGEPAIGASPVTRAGIGSLEPPEFKTFDKPYETPEVKTPAQLAAEDEAFVAPKMQSYDDRMQKYMGRALAQQRGEGIKKPTRLERGLGAFMTGASAEYAAARAAGVRPSLGAALAAAGGAASKADAALAEKVEEMQEKGYQAAMALEQSRMAYESGQKEMGAKYRDQADKLQAEARGIRNQTKKDEREALDKLNDRSMEIYKIEAQRQEKELDRKYALKVANVRAASSGSGQQLTPARLAEIRRKVEADVDKKLKEDVSYLMINHRDIGAKEAYRERELQRRMSSALQEEMGGILPPAPGSTPGVAAPAGWGKAQLVP